MAQRGPSVIEVEFEGVVPELEVAAGTDGAGSESGTELELGEANSFWTVGVDGRDGSGPGGITGVLNVEPIVAEWFFCDTQGVERDGGRGSRCRRYRRSLGKLRRVPDAESRVLQRCLELKSQLQFQSLSSSQVNRGAKLERIINSRLAQKIGNQVLETRKSLTLQVSYSHNKSLKLDEWMDDLGKWGSDGDVEQQEPEEIHWT